MPHEPMGHSPQASQEIPARSQLERIDEATANLFNALAVLRDRLSIVLTPENTIAKDAVPSEPARPDRSELVERLTVVAERLESQEENVEQIVSRLEI